MNFRKLEPIVAAIKLHYKLYYTGRYDRQSFFFGLAKESMQKSDAPKFRNTASA